MVTGVPNYDNISQFIDNDFPHRNYVMVATTDMRETFRYEDTEQLKQLMPVQNGGISAYNIAHIFRNFIEHNQIKPNFKNPYFELE